jgi:NADPH-dependent ferric siderophore reductase
MISLTNIKVTYKTATGGSGEGNAAPVALRMFFANEEAQQLEAEQNSYLLSVDANTIAFAFSVLNPKEEVKDEPVVEPEVPTESEIPEEPTEPEAPVEPERFTPKKLKVELSKNKITQGDKVIVNVKTESDVAYIVVNGEKVTKYQANRFSKQRTWTVILTAEEAGEMKVAVVAYDKADVASEPVSKTVKVERKIFKPQKLEVKVNDKKVQEGDKAKVTVTTSKDVAYIVVNGEKIMKFQTDRHNKQRTWTVELTAEEAGDMRVEVIAYNLDGVASEAEAETVTVQAKKSHKNHAWNEMMNLWGKYFD